MSRDWTRHVQNCPRFRAWAGHGLGKVSWGILELKGLGMCAEWSLLILSYLCKLLATPGAIALFGHPPRPNPPPKPKATLFLLGMGTDWDLKADALPALGGAVGAPNTPPPPPPSCHSPPRS